MGAAGADELVSGKRNVVLLGLLVQSTCALAWSVLHVMCQRWAAGWEPSWGVLVLGEVGEARGGAQYEERWSHREAVVE